MDFLYDEGGRRSKGIKTVKPVTDESDPSVPAFEITLTEEAPRGSVQWLILPVNRHHICVFEEISDTVKRLKIRNATSAFPGFRLQGRKLR